MVLVRDALRRYALSPYLAIALMTLMIPRAEGADVSLNRIGDPILNREEDVAGVRDPQDIAVDTEGDIYVVDQHYHRVQKYDSKGFWIDSIGTPSTDGTY